MEFGLFFNGYLPGPAAHDPDSEHLMLMREAEYAVLGDRHNWKYAWFGEHHGLTEYSHMSAPYPVMGYVAGRTNQIHVGSAITSFPTSKDHPVRIAERAAMMDHLSEGRFEFGTGRGAGSPEVRTFNGTELTETTANTSQHPPEALRRGPPPDVGGVRQSRHLRKSRGHGPRRDRLQLRTDPQLEGAG